MALLGGRPQLYYRGIKVIWRPGHRLRCRARIGFRLVKFLALIWRLRCFQTLLLKNGGRMES
jgi:hypothetical protein